MATAPKSEGRHYREQDIPLEPMWAFKHYVPSRLSNPCELYLCTVSATRAVGRVIEAQQQNGGKGEELIHATKELSESLRTSFQPRLFINNISTEALYLAQAETLRPETPKQLPV
jgi:hypothetical protein